MTITRLLISIFLFMIFSPASAENLISIYNRAVDCDPIFQAAYAELLANREDIPINRAELLPKIDLTGNLSRQRYDVDGLINIAPVPAILGNQNSETFYNNHAEYALTISQPIFNFVSWAKLQNAKADVKSAEATFCAEVQALIIRVATAYFAVLEAYDNLLFVRAEKAATYRELKDNRERFKVGLIAITPVYEAEAKYDTIVAEEVSAENDVSNRLEELREITGCIPDTLQSLNSVLPLISPQPNNIHQWVHTAECHNYELEAARYNTLAARENIKVQAGEHLPKIQANGEFHYTNDSNPFGQGVALKIKETSVGVSGEMPVYHGGEINARTRQAQFQFQQACQQQVERHRQVISDTRKAFLGVVLGIRKVLADKQAIKSNTNSVETTIESYRAGTRTILDVLSTQSSLYEAQKNYAFDRYEYILQTLKLKQEAGTLCAGDLIPINSWLTKTENLSAYNANRLASQRRNNN